MEDVVRYGIESYSGGEDYILMGYPLRSPYSGEFKLREE
jgi:hypothetical protein